MSNAPDSMDSPSYVPSYMLSNMTPMESQCPPPPDVLTMSDLLSDQSVVVAKEQADKALLETIGTQGVSNLRPKLVEWVLKGRPDGFPILTLNICPPSACSDGESRNLADYISFCSGKTIQEHVALLQAKLPDIQVSFANFGGAVAVTVLKA
jgi:hypothetical protein